MALLPTNLSFLLLEWVPLKLILFLTFYSISLVFLNIQLQHYHITGNDAHAEMKSYRQCVTFVRGVTFFYIFLLHDTRSFPHSLMCQEQFYMHLLPGQSGMYCWGQSD